MGGAVALSVGLAGCLGSAADPEQPATDPPTDELDVDNPDPVSEAAFEAWEPDTTCNGGEQESMHNSEISVRNVLDDQPAGVKPVAYDGRPDAQKEILAEVLAVGGYATCEPSEPFLSFLQTAVYDYAAEQERDDTSVWLAYDGTYYKLYLRKQDEVYAY